MTRYLAFAVLWITTPEMIQHQSACQYKTNGPKLDGFILYGLEDPMATFQLHHQTLEMAMFGVSLRDRIINEAIRSRTKCSASDFYHEANYSTVTGIAAYRSALTLDWLFDEDSRQREYAHAYEKDMPVLTREQENSECMEYSRPTAGKVARLMLELLKNLEGDEDLIQDLGHTLVRSQLLVRTSQLDNEPDLSSLVHTPELMQGEPHVTLPRVLAVVWVLASDRHVTRENGWCDIEKLNEYLDAASPTEIAVRMRLVDPILARARFILEDFMQTVTPLKIGRKLRPVALKTKVKKQKYLHRFSTKPPRSTVRRSNNMPTRTLPIITALTSKPDTTPFELVRFVASSSDVDVVMHIYVHLVLCLFVI